MSKKCCGIIYKDEKFCTMCGKALADLTDIDEQEAEAKDAGDVVKDADKETDKELDKEVPDETAENVVKKATDDSAVMLDMAEVDKIAASVLGDKTQGAMGDSSKSAADNEGGEKPEEKPTDKVEETADSDFAEQVEEKSQDKLDDNDASSDNKSKQDESDEEDDDDEDYDDGSASGGLKFFGTLMILAMLASIAFVGLAVYFVMLNPFYKNHDINNPVVYDQMATDTDVTNIESRPVLSEVSLEEATATDAEEVASAGDASENDDAETEEAGEDGSDNEDSDSDNLNSEGSESDESEEE